MDWSVSEVYTMPLTWFELNTVSRVQIAWHAYYRVAKCQWELKAEAEKLEIVRNVFFTLSAPPSSHYLWLTQRDSPLLQSIRFRPSQEP